MTAPSKTTFPALFLAHGSPTVAVEDSAYTRAVGAYASRLPRPDAIVVVSAHWEALQPLRVTAMERPKLIYDFGGFPPALYDLTYPAPGAPGLASDATALLSASGIAAIPERSRGLDHGVWVPLRHAYPDATIPVVEVSLPIPRGPENVLAIGRALAPLRERGVLLVGSGGIVHNLRRVDLRHRDAPVASWAKEFDDWIAARLDAHDGDALLRYRETAPHAEAAVPTPEHFDPLYFVIGAAKPEDRVVTLHDGLEYGSLSMRSFALGA